MSYVERVGERTSIIKIKTMRSLFIYTHALILYNVLLVDILQCGVYRLFDCGSRHQL